MSVKVSHADNEENVDEWNKINSCVLNEPTFSWFVEFEQFVESTYNR